MKRYWRSLNSRYRFFLTFRHGLYYKMEVIHILIHEVKLPNYRNQPHMNVQIFELPTEPCTMDFRRSWWLANHFPFLFCTIRNQLILYDLLNLSKYSKVSNLDKLSCVYGDILLTIIFLKKKILHHLL